MPAMGPPGGVGKLRTLIVALHLCGRGLPSPPKYATSDRTPPPPAPDDR